MTDYKALIALFKAEVISAVSYLEYSNGKIQSLPIDPKDLNAETLETWESFSARFARVTDILLTKYLRAVISEADPAFRGEVRDIVDKSEKMHLISQADLWMEVRELRNKISHEYTRQDLAVTFSNVKRLTPFVIAEVRKLFP